MKFLMTCFCVLAITISLTLMFLGPSAKRLGAERAILEIEASACGDTIGDVAKGWEDRCSERAASNRKN